MWQFLRRNQDGKQAETTERRRPLGFPEVVAGMGDFSDLATHDAALKFWLPEAASCALREMGEREYLSASEFLRQFLAVHCYGLYAFHQMTDKMPGLFKECSGIRYSIAWEEPAIGKKRIATYWVPELGKNVIAIKVWIPTRMKADLQALSGHVGLTLSNYVREILISRLLGHGMLPQRPTMLIAFPTAATDDWEEDREVPWREIAEDVARSQTFMATRTEWIDSPNEVGA